MQAETGKVRADAEHRGRRSSATRSTSGARTRRSSSPTRSPSPHNPMFKVKRLRILYRPYPVVGVISPWNFPLILALRRRDPGADGGLRGGGQAVRGDAADRDGDRPRLEEEIGGPDVLDVVNGTARPGGALIDEADFVQFTGSDRTGRIVMKRAADTLTPVSLELGGKDPMIVLRDANIERAVNARRLRRRSPTPARSAWRSSASTSRSRSTTSSSTSSPRRCGSCARASTTAPTSRTSAR